MIYVIAVICVIVISRFIVAIILFKKDMELTKLQRKVWRALDLGMLPWLYALFSGYANVYLYKYNMTIVTVVVAISCSTVIPTSLLMFKKNDKVNEDSKRMTPKNVKLIKIGIIGIWFILAVGFSLYYLNK